jgi:hypothetical protein
MRYTSFSPNMPLITLVTLKDICEYFRSGPLPQLR